MSIVDDLRYRATLMSKDVEIAEVMGAVGFVWDCFCRVCMR